MGVFRQFPYSNFHEMNMDEIIKIVKNMLEEWAQYHAEWDAWMTEINDDWSNYQEVMNEAWENMQNFINNYFDNLDVQEEINNKINNMVHTGEFASIVEPYIPPQVTAWLAEHITQPVGVVIDTSLTIAGACADAKATGDAINDVKSALTKGAYEQSDNLLDFGYLKNTWVQGGSLSDTSLYKCRTKPIPATAGNIIYGVINKAKYERTFNFAQMAMWVIAYDSNNTELGSKMLSNSTYQATYDYELPVDTEFIIIQLTTGNYNDQFTPTQLDNAVEAFAYAGYKYISASQVYPNYISANTRISKNNNNILSTVWNKKLAIANYGEWQLGSYDHTDGSYVPTNTFRVCSLGHLKSTVPLILSVNSGYQFQFVTYNNGVFSGYYSGWLQGSATIPSDTEFALSIAKNPEDFTTADISIFTNAVSILLGSSSNDQASDESILARRLVSRIYDKSDNGNFYGFESIDYVAQTTSENWQTKANTEEIIFNLNPNTLITIGCLARHGLGNQFATITFFRSDDTQIAYYSALKTNTDINCQGGFIKTWLAPAGTAYAKVQFQTISNAQTAGESSVVGETYFTKYGFAYIGSLFEENYSYMAFDWKSAIETIKTEQEDKFVIGIQTDTHYFNGCSNAIGRNLNELTKWVAMDCIANLGDIIQGYDDAVIDTPSNSRASMTEIVQRYCNGSECPVMLLLGNHDSNSMHATAYGSDEFSFGELYARLIKPSINTNPNAKIENGKFYYYTDFPALRLIVLNTNDGATPHSFAISNEQLTWFENVALDTNMPVLVISHVCLAPGVSQNYDASYAGIVSALVAFKNNGGDVVACLNGHEHAQGSTTSDNILFITFDDSIGFAGENTAEIVTVDTTNKTIETYGFGNASSRTFNY